MAAKGSEESAGSRKNDNHSVVPEPWSSLQFYTDLAPAFPDAKDTGEVSQPCFLYRSSENWLGRFAAEIKEDERRKSIREEVRAVSAQWLKMQNVCVLLGAGASFYITGFVASGMYEAVKKLLTGRSSLATLEKFLSFGSKPDQIGIHFERLLSQLSALGQLSGKASIPLDKLPFDSSLPGAKEEGGVSKAVRDLLLDIEKAIAILCNVELPGSQLNFEDKELTPHETFLAKLVARDPQQGRSRIFTPNYDTLVEQAMDRLGIFYSDGFSGTVRRRFNPASYDLDLHYPGEVTEGRVRRYDKVLHLYKLHGSINWRRSEGEAENPHGIAFDSRPLPRIDDVKAGIEVFSKVFDSGEGLAILPTSGKYWESLSMPFAHLFRSMGQVLREPQTLLFIIGYSGWDSHINQIVADSLTNPGFTCVIVDPKPSKWAQQLCRVDQSGRVYCFGGEWGKFEFFSRHVLPDLEVLKAELAIARTLRDLRRADAENKPSVESQSIGEKDA